MPTYCYKISTYPNQPVMAERFIVVKQDDASITVVYHGIPGIKYKKAGTENYKIFTDRKAAEDYWKTLAQKEVEDLQARVSDLTEDLNRGPRFQDSSILWISDHSELVMKAGAVDSAA